MNVQRHKGPSGVENSYKMARDIRNPDDGGHLFSSGWLEKRKLADDQGKRYFELF